MFRWQAGALAGQGELRMCAERKLFDENLTGFYNARFAADSKFEFSGKHQPGLFMGGGCAAAQSCRASNQARKVKTVTVFV